jgi:hypothetical protein
MNWCEPAYILIVQWKIVEIVVKDGAKEEVLEEHRCDWFIFIERH